MHVIVASWHREAGSVPQGHLDSGWLKILDVNGGRAAVISLACLAVNVCFREHWLGLEALPQWVPPLTGIGFIFFGLVGLAGVTAKLLGSVWRKFRAAMQSRRAHERFLLDLSSKWETLARDEALIFFSLIARGQRSQVFELGLFRGSAPANGLIQRGLLVTEVSYGNDHYMLKVPDKIWQHRAEILPIATQALAQIEAMNR